MMKMYKSIFRRNSHTFLDVNEFCLLLEIIINVDNEKEFKLVDNEIQVFDSLEEKGFIITNEKDEVDYISVDPDIQYFYINLDTYTKLKNKYTKDEIYLYFLLEAMNDDKLSYQDAIDVTNMSEQEIDSALEKFKEEIRWEL